MKSIRYILSILFLTCFAQIATACTSACCPKKEDKKVSKACCCIKASTRLENGNPFLNESHKSQNTETPCPTSCPDKNCNCLDFTGGAIAFLEEPLIFNLNVPNYILLKSNDCPILYDESWIDYYLASSWHPPINA